MNSDMVNRHIEDWMDKNLQDRIDRAIDHRIHVENQKQLKKYYEESIIPQEDHIDLGLFDYEHIKPKLADHDLTQEDLNTRRLAGCVERFPDAHDGAYNPACCRFPKSCSPHGYIEAVLAGNLTENDLEPKGE